MSPVPVSRATDKQRRVRAACAEITFILCLTSANFEQDLWLVGGRLVFDPALSVRLGTKAVSGAEASPVDTGRKLLALDEGQNEGKEVGVLRCLRKSALT